MRIEPLSPVRYSPRPDREFEELLRKAAFHLKTSRLQVLKMVPPLLKRRATG